MATLYSVTISSTGDLPEPAQTGNPKASIARLRNTLSGLVSGASVGATITFRQSLVQASGTVTCASAAGGDTVTIAGQVLTATTGSGSATLFALGANNTTAASGLAACINANTTLIQGLSASSSGTTVTITALVGGTAGNLITLASSSATKLAVSGALLTAGAQTSFVFTQP